MSYASISRVTGLPVCKIFLRRYCNFFSSITWIMPSKATQSYLSWFSTKCWMGLHDVAPALKWPPGLSERHAKKGIMIVCLLNNASPGHINGWNYECLGTHLGKYGMSQELYWITERTDLKNTTGAIHLFIWNTKKKKCWFSGLCHGFLALVGVPYVKGWIGDQGMVLQPRNRTCEGVLGDQADHRAFLPLAHGRKKYDHCNCCQVPCRGICNECDIQ